MRTRPRLLGVIGARHPKSVESFCHANISVRVAGVSSDRMPLHWMASHFGQLVRYSAGAAILLLAFWTSLAVSATTPARRPRPNGPRSRVTRSIPSTNQACEAIEPLWITARESDLFVSASDSGEAGFLSYPVRPTCSDIVIGGFVTIYPRITVFPPSPPRGPPLITHSLS